MSGRVNSSDVQTTETLRELRHCPSCHCDLVQPHEWEPTGRERWRMTLRCPSCQRIERDVFTAAEVALFEEHIDAGVTMLLDDLTILTGSNLADEIEFFIKALGHDLLRPEDF